MNEESTATMKRTSDASVAVIRGFLDALASGDTEAMGALLANDIEWNAVRAEVGLPEPPAADPSA